MATKTQEQRIAKWVSNWKSRLLLEHWAVIVVYEDADEKDSGSDMRMATIVMNSRYREASLHIYPCLLEMPIGYQKATILHELMHILTLHVKTALDKAHSKGAITMKERTDVLEGITEDITKIVLRERKPGKDNYRL